MIIAPSEASRGVSGFECRFRGRLNKTCAWRVSIVRYLVNIMATIGKRIVLVLLCLVLGNFVLFHDRERIVMAQYIEDEPSLRGMDLFGESPKGNISSQTGLFEKSTALRN
uniref:Uncharacterized protein n=1 Tax=Anopheles farauti TaxID=69004 RepID=A0A182QY50_9DIPT